MMQATSNCRIEKNAEPSRDVSITNRLSISPVFCDTKYDHSAEIKSENSRCCHDAIYFFWISISSQFCAVNSTPCTITDPISTRDTLLSVGVSPTRANIQRNAAPAVPCVAWDGPM